MHLFGLTGGIASGKSRVASRLRARHVPVIDADVLAREAVAPGSAGLARVVETFGPGILAADGSLDRKKLAQSVFSSDAQRAALNAIVHPIVADLTRQAAARLAEAGEPLACYEAALIVENGVADALRPLIVVSAPESAQIERAMARDGATASDARARIAAQYPLAAKVAVADYVIDNGGSLSSLDEQTDKVLASICARLGIDSQRYA